MKHTIFINEHAMSINLTEVLNTKYFANLDSEEISVLKKYATIKTFSSNEIILLQGQQPEGLYIILNGSVKVSLTTNSNEHYYVATISEGGSFGEMEIIEKSPCAASVISLEKTKVLFLSINDIEKHKELSFILMPIIAKVVSHRLTDMDTKTISILEEKLKGEKSQNMLRSFIINFMILMIIYGWMISIKNSFLIVSFVNTNKILIGPILSLFVITIFSIGSFYVSRSTAYTIDIFGVNTNNWQISIIESICLSVFIVLTAFYIKCLYLIIVHHANDLKTAQNIVLSSMIKYLSIRNIIAIVVYILAAPFQEFIGRGVLQTSFYILFDNKKYRLFKAILMSNGMFSIAHIHLDLMFMIGSFLLGCYWGWLYQRHNTLIGVSISHMIMGVILPMIV